MTYVTGSCTRSEWVLCNIKVSYLLFFDTLAILKVIHVIIMSFKTIKIIEFLVCYSSPFK